MNEQLSKESHNDNPDEIFRAIRNHNAAQVHRILQACPEAARSAGRKGITPLHMACDEVHLRIATLLLDHGADVCARCDADFTPLHEAARSSMLMHRWAQEACAYLKERKASFQRQFFLEDQPNLLELLIHRGADVNSIGHAGWTPLISAVWNTGMGCCQTLLENGADPNTCEDQGLTPLHISACCSRGKMDHARMLLEFGAQPDVKDNRGDTPLHTAIKCCNAHVAEVLLEGGADIRAKNASNQTALELALAQAYDEGVRVLKEFAR